MVGRLYQEDFPRPGLNPHRRKQARIKALRPRRIQDDVDAVVVDRPAAEGYIETQGGLVTVEESLSGIQGLAFAYPSDSDLVLPINAAMSALQASGKWDEIYAKWFESGE